MVGLMFSLGRSSALEMPKSRFRQPSCNGRRLPEKREGCQAAFLPFVCA
ncbi:hypothetical protein EIKCOROL_00242 [Eikenella corrodens ATCC 23834]|uniref:Uncharacterized protein n=1 Tax=Eikenella corrodens ATCC 23834 TaxID=546274 RepID=C0DSC0_EIKCO|nr:hypothetical protein EIKCOROL_00242 [Eikenella corrodens ATCC 23834]